MDGWIDSSLSTHTLKGGEREGRKQEKEGKGERESENEHKSKNTPLDFGGARKNNMNISVIHCSKLKGNAQ